MPGWVRAYLTGVLTAVGVAGLVLWLRRPPSHAIDVIMATPAPVTIAVSLSGEVARPGLYQLAPGSRVADLLQQAGGTTEAADPAAPSRALLLRDEMHVHVPRAAPSAALLAATSPPTPSAGTAVGPTEPAGSATPEATPAEVASAPPSGTPTPRPAAEPAAPTRAPTVRSQPPAPAGPINVNTASAAELEGLPDIGPVLAARIVADRERNGPFRSVDDLDRVAGIGSATLARLRPLVRV